MAEIKVKDFVTGPGLNGADRYCVQVLRIEGDEAVLSVDTGSFNGSYVTRRPLKDLELEKENAPA